MPRFSAFLSIFNCFFYFIFFPFLELDSKSETLSTLHGLIKHLPKENKALLQRLIVHLGRYNLFISLNLFFFLLRQCHPIRFIFVVIERFMVNVATYIYPIYFTVNVVAGKRQRQISNYIELDDHENCQKFSQSQIICYSCLRNI